MHRHSTRQLTDRKQLLEHIKRASSLHCMLHALHHRITAWLAQPSADKRQGGQAPAGTMGRG